MDADLYKIIGEYIWLPALGAIGGLWKMLNTRIDKNSITIEQLESQLNSVKLEYVQKVDFERSIEKLENKIDKHSDKLDKILERLPK